MEIDNDVLKKLSQVGYLGCMQGFTRRGEKIMQGIHNVRPNEIPILMGLAISKIYTQKFSEAVTIISENVLKQEPDNMAAMCFLGVALYDMGEEIQAKYYFSEVIKSEDEYLKALCNEYLEK